MRKMIALVLVFLFAFSPAVMAEGIDLEAMTLDELSALRKAIDTEIDARLDRKLSVIPAGVYVVGEGIKAGKYIISANEEYFGFDVATFGTESIYNQAIAENNESLASFNTYVSRNESAFVLLKDGMVLVVSGTAMIEEAKADWIP